MRTFTRRAHRPISYSPPSSHIRPTHIHLAHFRWPPAVALGDLTALAGRCAVRTISRGRRAPFLSLIALRASPSRSVAGPMYPATAALARVPRVCAIQPFWLRGRARGTEGEFRVFLRRRSGTVSSCSIPEMQYFKYIFCRYQLVCTYAFQRYLLYNCYPRHSKEFH